MDFIRQSIRISRPNIKDQTINNYIRFLNRIAKEVTGETLKSLNFLKDIQKTQLFLDAMSFNSRRTTLIAIVVGLKSINDPHGVKAIYDALLMKAKGDYFKSLNTQQKSAKTMENWTTMKKLIKIRKLWKKKVDDFNIVEKTELTKKQNDLLQTYLIASLYTMIPPRRCIYGIVKLISTANFKKLTDEQRRDNFFVFSDSFRIMYFYFGNQKSATESKKHAKQKVPKKLRNVLELFLRFNSDREYLLVNNRGGMLGLDGCGRHLKDIFGVGPTMIRKIYISENTKVAHDLIENIASKMGHSVGMARASYVKK